MADVEIQLLGTAQDAGIPQAGCVCGRCLRAQLDAERRRHPCSLGIVHHPSRRFWLIDCTPAFPAQLHHLLSRHSGYSLGGIFLTHAHMGHYTGLIHCGEEAWNTSSLPLWMTRRMLEFLAGNQPWGTIIEQNCRVEIIDSGENVALAQGLSLEALAVPHRGEFSDTLSFFAHTPKGSLYYCPDIDAWAGFPIKTVLDRVDFALLDGTFYSPEELPGRDLSQVPHPFALETVGLAAGHRAEVWLVHLNHSNPLNDPGPERVVIQEKGIRAAGQWQCWEL